MISDTLSAAADEISDCLDSHPDTYQHCVVELRDLLDQIGLLEGILHDPDHADMVVYHRISGGGKRHYRMRSSR